MEGSPLLRATPCEVREGGGLVRGPCAFPLHLDYEELEHQREEGGRIRTGQGKEAGKVLP